MTFTQKCLRPILNFLVERFFPNGAFYGRDFFDAFKEIQPEGATLGQASVLWIIHGMHEGNIASVEFDISDVSIRGKPVGDFHIVGSLNERGKA